MFTCLRLNLTKDRKTNLSQSLGLFLVSLCLFSFIQFAPHEEGYGVKIGSAFEKGLMWATSKDGGSPKDPNHVCAKHMWDDFAESAG